jgi:homoaconitate hydratase
MTHDNTSAVMARFRAIGRSRILHPERCVVALDHDVQNRAEDHRARYAAIEAFAREQGVEFHAAGSGIGHQIMIERGHVTPGAIVAAADSHANMYGAEGALGIPVTRADAAAIWSSGIFWWEVPEVVRVVLTGRLPEGGTGKDVALILCSLYPDDVLGAAVEICGAGLATLAQDDRRTLANLTTEWGASACVVVEDAGLEPSGYAATIRLDLGTATPHVAGPDTLARAVPVDEIAPHRIAIQKAYLVSCANARASDFEAAAAVLRGHRVADGVRLFIAAASAAVERDARAAGAWDALLAAGAIALPSGCGPCIGLGAGLLEDEETGISASNRNFRGRMGSPRATCYLASPAVVAASALAGHITGPGRTSPHPKARAITRHDRRPRIAAAGSLAAPAIEGRLVAFLRDAIDTDALCPARFVYADATPATALAGAVLESTDPSFAARVHTGDVLVAGSRFGIGSSREQAVTALRALGIRAVVAASLAPSFRRNAWNNGLLAVESPRFVEALRGTFAGAAVASAVIPGGAVTIDPSTSTVAFGDLRAPFGPLPSVAHELLAAGGLDAYLRASGTNR